MLLREAQKDLAISAGGSAREKTLDPTHRGKDQVKTGQNIANLRRREMSGLT